MSTTDLPEDVKIPVALVGPRTLDQINTFAPLLGVTPVRLLREAVAIGLLGEKAVLQEVLDVARELLQEEQKAMQWGPSSPKEEQKPS